MSEPDIAFKAAWLTAKSLNPVRDESILVCRPGGEILIAIEAPVFPESPVFSGEPPTDWKRIGIGFLGESLVILVSAPPGAEAPGGYEWRSPRTLFAGLTPALVEATSRASMLVSWDNDHRFCGRCGGSTELDMLEAARVCSGCGYRAYPRVSPAMIVLIEAAPEAGFSEPRILLAHNSHFPDDVYSCVAGYVDAGETLEATVLREVREEVGLDAAPPVYVRSQAWPLPHSLMLGFRTTAFGEPLPDGVEITDARWFPASGLPHIPRHGTIARTLIDDWLERIGAEPYSD